MLRFSLFALTLGALGVAAAGCTGSYRTRGTVTTTTVAPADMAPADAELAYVRPGVWAVTDYPEPVFYADDVYWRYDHGRWYRSRRLGAGWASVNASVVPRPVE